MCIRDRNKITWIVGDDELKFTEKDKRWITSLKSGVNGKYTARYVGSLVADFHRNLLKGGIFSYPADPKTGIGRLRLIYECNPLSFIAKNTNGYASDGEIRSNDIFSKIKEWAPGGVNIILDPVGGEYFERNLDVLSIEGKLIVIGLMGGAKANLNLGLLMVKRQKIIGSTIRARSNETKNIVMQELSEKVIPLFESGMLKPVIHETFYFSECNEAQKMMEANENIGKIILALD